jgi:hypothetical protein
MSAAEQKKPEPMDVEKTMGDMSKKMEDATHGLDSSLSGLTKWLETFFKSWPQLPKGFTDWLSKNVYWLALVGGILSLIVGVFGLIGLPSVLSATSTLDDVARAFGVATQLGWQYKFASVVSVVQSILSAVLLLLAYTPLKAMKASGWKFLYWNALLVWGINLLYSLITVNIFSLVLNVLFGAIGLWILFSIRPAFKK